jgi:hypothetical protein
MLGLVGCQVYRSCQPASVLADASVTLFVDGNTCKQKTSRKICARVQSTTLLSR